MSFLESLFSFLFGIRRTFDEYFLTKDIVLEPKDLLGMSMYNFGTKPVKIFKYTLPAWDGVTAPHVYVLDTLPIAFTNDLKIPIIFEGNTPEENKVYITYSALTKC